jgi:hypothetical protein
MANLKQIHLGSDKNKVIGENLYLPVPMNTKIFATHIQHYLYGSQCSWSACNPKNHLDIHRDKENPKKTFSINCLLPTVLKGF